MARTAVLTKDMILDAALKIMNTQGPEAITIRAIATSLGKSTAPIYTQYPSREAIMVDLEAYTTKLLHAYIETPRTIDSFQNIGLGILAFALEHKKVFTYYYLTEKATEFDIKNDESRLLGLMKKNTLLTVLEDQRLLKLLEDMWIYTYGLATMICTGIEASQDLDYYRRKLEIMGNQVISYHLFSSGKYEAYMQAFAAKVSEHVDLKEVFKS